MTTTTPTLINRGLAADAGYRGTFGYEAEQSRRAAGDLPAQGTYRGDGALPNRAAAGRPPPRSVSSLGRVRLGELPEGPGLDGVAARRARARPAVPPDALVLVDHEGRGYPADEVSACARRARSTRISIDGNAHFCRGLLRTRYPKPDHAERRRSYAPTHVATEPGRRNTPDEHDRAVQVAGYHQPLELAEIPTPSPPARST